MKTLFVCTDLSSAGNNSVRFAAHLAEDFGCELIVFHAVHLPPFKPTIEESELNKFRKDTEAAQQKDLELLVTSIYREEGLKRTPDRVRTAVRIEAFAADAIMEGAAGSRADLIIAGTHGATGMKMLGSITNEIIFKSETPVLAIPPESKYRRIQTLVYATDLNNTVNELRCIVPIAAKMDAIIEILYLDFGKDDGSPSLDEKELVKQIGYDRIKVVIRKERKGANMVEEMEQYIESRKPDILVMFPEERSVLDKIFVRSKTEELAYDAKLPLLTFLKSQVGK